MRSENVGHFGAVARRQQALTGAFRIDFQKNVRVIRRDTEPPLLYEPLMDVFHIGFLCSKPVHPNRLAPIRHLSGVSELSEDARAATASSPRREKSMSGFMGSQSAAGRPTLRSLPSVDCL